MELLVVMAIMLTISTILVAGYFGMTRAASNTAAESDVYNLLQLARQRACMDGTRVFFLLIDNRSCVLVHGGGEVTSIEAGGQRIYDAYADHRTVSSGNAAGTNLRLWNMNADGRADDVTIAYSEKSEPVAGGPSSDRYLRRICAIDGRFTGVWKIGDRYGFELYPRHYLPKGFSFGVPGRGADPNLHKIIFNPDGKPEGALEFRIYEKIVKPGKGQDAKVTISLDGSIVISAVDA